MTNQQSELLIGNLEALRSADHTRRGDARHGEFLEDLHAAYTDTRLSVRSSSSGHAVPEITNGKGSYTLHSRYDPLKEAERALGSVAATGTLCIFGLGFGYHVKRALEQAGFVRIIVVCEPLDVVKSMLARVDLRSVLCDPRLYLVSSRSESGIAHVIPRVHVPYFSTRLSALHLATFARVFPARFERFRRAFERSIQIIGDDLTTQIRYASVWFRNILLNSLSAHETQPMSLPGNRPVTVVAAGPSLEEHLKRIRRSSDFVFICDTAAPALRHSGAKNDAVLSIDPSVYSYHHLMNGYPDGAQSILDAGVHPSVWRGAPNRSGVVSAHPLVHLMSPVFDHLPRVQFNSDVTHAAVWIAKSCGMEPVTVIGADYCWASGKPYARSTYIPRLFLSTSSRTSTNEALTVDFMFANHASLQREENGDYRVSAFAARREALHTLLETPFRSFLPLSAGTTAASDPAALPVVLDRLSSLVSCLPPADGTGAEAFFRNLDTDQQTAAFLIAPLAARLSQGPSDDDRHGRIMDYFDEAKANAIQLIERVHSLSVSRIL